MVDASRVWFICFGFFFSPLVPSPVSKVLRDPGATAALDVNASIQKKEWFVRHGESVQARVDNRRAEDGCLGIILE